MKFSKIILYITITNYLDYTNKCFFNYLNFLDQKLYEKKFKKFLKSKKNKFI